MTIKNKIVGSFLVLILISLTSSVFISYEINEIGSDVEKLTNKDFQGVSYLLEADRDSYQSNVALLQLMSLKTQEEIDKKIKKGVSNNLLQVRQRFDKFKKILASNLTHKQKEFDDFDKFYKLTENSTNKIISLVKNNNLIEAEELYFSTYLKSYESMRDTMDFFTGEAYKLIEENKKGISSLISNATTAFVVIAIFSILITILFSYLLGRSINSSLGNFQLGLLNFFKYLNRETNEVSLLNDSTKDEVSQMAKVVNENITKTKSLIEQDDALIADVKRVVSSVKEGYLNQSINKSTQNKGLEDLKIIFNEMLNTISSNVCEDLNKLEDALKDFQDLDFRHRIKDTNSKTSLGLNSLAETITDILLKNKSNGVTLQDSANNLLVNVDILNTSANQTAASLEETSASLEEITATVVSNNQSIHKMSQYSQEVTQAVKNGEKLANETTTAMDELNEQVSAINDSIGVIDQIAFQTNILSLNAAVEAATAGEAGKGFAVVAQEVRNLASRSAEAAKEIKDLVENATNKSKEGKLISSSMIEGYTSLNENVEKTMSLINSVSDASKEQQLGIEQINDAISKLDQQTQQNANVSERTKNIAIETQDIANSIVSDANEKEFDGKDSIKANHNSSNANTQNEVRSKKVSKPLNKVQDVAASKEVVANNDNGEWESF